MEIRSGRWALCVVAVLCLAAPAAAAPPQSRTPPPTATATATPVPAETVAVKELVGQVNLALGHVNYLLAAPTSQFVLDSVSVALQTVAERQNDGTVKFLIFRWGSRKTTSLTNRFILTFSSPATKAAVEPDEKWSGKPVEQQPLAEGLASTIVAGLQAEQDAHDAVPGLVPNKLTCEISFGVRKEGEAGLTVALAPIEIGGGTATAMQTTQTITVTFTRKRK